MKRVKKAPKKSKLKRSKPSVESDEARATNRGGSELDFYQTNSAKGNLGTLEGETTTLTHQITNRRVG